MALLYAHRGAAIELPENTLPSFARALEVGAGALEMDVHASRDGVLVVAHDPDGLRLARDPRQIRACTWAELERWDLGQGIHPARLVDVLRTFPGVPLNVDLKADVGPLAVALLRAEGAEERVCLASFSARTLGRVRALGYRGPTSLARSEVAQLLSLPAAVQRGPLKPAGTAAQLPASLARPWVITRCHALGLRVDFWTVNDLAQAQALLAMGADGLMTDDPRKLAPLFR